MCIFDKNYTLMKTDVFEDKLFEVLGKIDFIINFVARENLFYVLTCSSVSEKEIAGLFTQICSPHRVVVKITMKPFDFFLGHLQS